MLVKISDNMSLLGKKKQKKWWEKGLLPIGGDVSLEFDTIIKPHEPEPNQDIGFHFNMLEVLKSDDANTTIPINNLHIEIPGEEYDLFKIQEETQKITDYVQKIREDSQRIREETQRIRDERREFQEKLSEISSDLHKPILFVSKESSFYKAFDSAFNPEWSRDVGSENSAEKESSSEVHSDIMEYFRQAYTLSQERTLSEKIKQISTGSSSSGSDSWQHMFPNLFEKTSEEDEEKPKLLFSMSDKTSVRDAFSIEERFGPKTGFNVEELPGFESNHRSIFNTSPAGASEVHPSFVPPDISYGAQPNGYGAEPMVIRATPDMPSLAGFNRAEVETTQRNMQETAKKALVDMGYGYGSSVSIEPDHRYTFPILDEAKKKEEERRIEAEAEALSLEDWRRRQLMLGPPRGPYGLGRTPIGGMVRRSPYG
jgi:hypothetical protein